MNPKRSRNSSKKLAQNNPSSSFRFTPLTKLYSKMVGHIGDELILVKSNGLIAYANDAAVRGLGHSRKFLLKSKITTFHKEKMTIDEWRKKYFLPLKRHKHPIRLEFQRVIKNGFVQTIDVSAVYLCHENEEYILSVGRDITALAHRIKNEDKMQEDSKMTALHLFVSGTAQEIKHPLQVILSHLQRMLNKYKDRNFEYIGFKEYTDIMRSMQNLMVQVRHCHGVADKLLEFSKRKAGIKKHSCRVNDGIKDSIHLLSQKFEQSNIKIQLQLSNRLPMVAIGAVELEEVALCIIENSIQAMPMGGKISIKTLLKKADNVIQIEFKDEGVGIPKEYLSRVFEPFFSTKERRLDSRAGLGLAIVYSIIQGHKGDVNITSSLRQGTLVKVSLPAYKSNNS